MNMIEQCMTIYRYQNMNMIGQCMTIYPYQNMNMIGQYMIIYRYQYMNMIGQCMTIYRYHTVGVRESHNGHTGSHYCTLLSDVCPEAKDVVENQEWFASLPAVMSATYELRRKKELSKG